MILNLNHIRHDPPTTTIKMIERECRPGKTDRGTAARACPERSRRSCPAAKLPRCRRERPRSCSPETNLSSQEHLSSRAPVEGPCVSQRPTQTQSSPRQATACPIFPQGGLFPIHQDRVARTLLSASHQPHNSRGDSRTKLRRCRRERPRSCKIVGGCGVGKGTTKSC